jgi:hypothetical protein
MAQNSPFNTHSSKLRSPSATRPNNTNAKSNIPDEDEEYFNSFNASVSEWNRGLDADDMNSMQGLSSLTSPALLEEVKKLEDRAYQLGLEESREMTRGKFLDVLSRNERIETKPTTP